MATTTADDAAMPDAVGDSKRARVVLLGASNVTRCISTIVETARLAVGKPMDVYAAFGHGRSLKLYTRVFGRGLCGLLDAGLWRALDGAAPRDDSYALLADIGNDLMYEAPLGEIFSWIDEIFFRCQSVARNVIVSELPLASVERLDAKRFLLLRRLIFPRCRLTLDEALTRARAINQRLHAIAPRYGATIAPLDGAWYGFDPIHIRRDRFAQAWSTILAPWAAGRTIGAAHGSLARWIYLRALSPEKRAFFGRERFRAQPAGRLSDGSTIGVY
jgi:hypothetical protein